MRFLNFLRRNRKWVAIALGALLFIFLVAMAIRAYTKEQPAEKLAEQAAPAVVVVTPVERTATHASATLSVPKGHFVFQFEDKDGVLVSDRDAGPTTGYEGMMEVFLSPESRGKEIFPVVYFNGIRFPGSPLSP